MNKFIIWAWEKFLWMFQITHILFFKILFLQELIDTCIGLLKDFLQTDGTFSTTKST